MTAQDHQGTPRTGACARYWGSDGTLCSTHHGRFASGYSVRCDRRAGDKAEAPLDVTELRTAVERLRNVSEPREYDLLNGAFDRRAGWNDAIDAVLVLLAGDANAAEASSDE